MPHSDIGRIPTNPNGGLTLVAMPGFEELTVELAERVRELGEKETRLVTPVDVVVPTVGSFESLEPKYRHTGEHIAGHDVMVITGGPGTREMLADTFLILGTLARRRPSRIDLFTPYFPLSRSDAERTDELNMAAILVEGWQGICHIGRRWLLDRVVCVDPHSDSITSVGGGGFVTPIRMTRKLLLRLILEAFAITDNVVISFPDNTSEKRFKDALPAVEGQLKRTFPIVFASAKRDANKKLIERISGDLEALRGALVIQIDDETATGGTQISVAHLLKRYGASAVWSAVTHGILCGAAPELFMDPQSPVDRLYIMDTILPHNRPELKPLLDSGLLRVISWFDDYAEIIYRVHWKMDVREMR